MEVPWGQALQVGGVGFGMVFALLIILVIVKGLTGLAPSQVGIDKDETDDKKRRLEVGTRNCRSSHDG